VLLASQHVAEDAVGQQIDRHADFGCVLSELLVAQLSEVVVKVHERTIFLGFDHLLNLLDCFECFDVHIHLVKYVFSFTIKVVFFILFEFIYLVAKLGVAQLIKSEKELLVFSANLTLSNFLLQTIDDVRQRAQTVREECHHSRK